MRFGLGDSKSVHSKGKRKEHKLAKKISRKHNHHRKEHPKTNNATTRRKRNYSPEYNNKAEFTPLFYSGDYKPNTDTQEETNENYECFISVELARRMQIEMQAEDEVLNKLAHFNI